MSLRYDWKIAVIGAGGKISGGVLFELLDKKNIGGGEIYLYGRTRAKVENNIRIAEKIAPSGNRAFRLTYVEDMDDALKEADIVFYSATPELLSFGGYRALGISQGAHILYIGEKMKALCPNAWLLVSTNPPDIPLMAVNRLFKLDKIIGLCNAPIIAKKSLVAYLSCNEEDLTLLEIGINHDVWFYDILLKGRTIYDELRKKQNWDIEDSANEYFNRFPEWKIALVNNIEILKQTGYLPCPVGGTKRFTGLPVAWSKIAELMKRPRDEDYLMLLEEDAGRVEILNLTRRCGGGITPYIGDVLGSILADDNKEHSLLVQNRGLFPSYPDEVMLQMTCRVGRKAFIRPDYVPVPGYIDGVLSPRVLQNNMAGRALALQSEKLMLQSMLLLPERVSPAKAADIIKTGDNVEPYMPLN